MSALGALTCAVLWPIATLTDWIADVRFVSHISMLTAIFTFIAAWRADVPNRTEEGHKINN